MAGIPVTTHPGVAAPAGLERERDAAGQGWFGVILGDGLPDPPVPFFADDAADAADTACDEYLSWLEESMGSAAPDTLEVNHPLLLQRLRKMRYAPARVRLRPQMPRLERLLGTAVLEVLSEETGGGPGAAAPRRGTATLEGEGVRDADVRALHAAVSALVAAGGWDRVPSGTTLKLIAPEPVPGMGLVMLQAREGTPLGLTFWDGEERYAASVAACNRGGPAEPGAAPDWVLSLGAAEALQEADLAIYERLDLPPLNVSGRERFPLLMGIEGEGVLVRASAERLRWLSSVLRSIGSMVAVHRDRGARWMPPLGFTIEQGGGGPVFHVQPFGPEPRPSDPPTPPAAPASPAVLPPSRDQLRDQLRDQRRNRPNR